jgi:hypothetical protein
MNKKKEFIFVDETQFTSIISHQLSLTIKNILPCALQGSKTLFFSLSAELPSQKSHPVFVRS